MTSKIEIRVSETEKQKIRAKAEQAGLSISAYVRKASLTKNITSNIDVEIEKNRLKQLIIISNNMNEIAKWAIKFKSEADSIQVIEHLVLIEELLQ